MQKQNINWIFANQMIELETSWELHNKNRTNNVIAVAARVSVKILIME